MKVMPAYRLKKGHNLWTTLQDIKFIAQGNINMTVQDMYQSWIKNPEMVVKIKNTMGLGSKHFIDGLTCSVYLQRLFAEGVYAKDPMYDMTVEVIVREYNKRHFLQPVCSGAMKNVMDFMQSYRRVEEMDYWDGPVPIPYTKIQWAYRRKAWRTMLDDEGPIAKRDRFVVLPICNLSNFSECDAVLNMGDSNFGSV